MRRILFAAIALTLIAGSLDRTFAQEKKTLLPTTGWGSLSGRIVYNGAPLPVAVDLAPKMAAHADKACCVATGAKTLDETWLVDPKTKGVANVLIYLKAPKGTYFPIHEQDKKRTRTLNIDQPNCVFIPRILAFYPAYFDGEKNVPTGEEFEVKNSATVPHNTRATGNPLYKNPGFNFTLPPGTAKKVELNPQPLPILVNCDIHPWMSAKVGVYDHPYFAVTKADGSFSIPRVPVGADIVLMGWHEDVGYIPNRDGVKLKLIADKNEVPDIGVSMRP